MLNLRKKFACVAVSAALACSMVPASALAAVCGAEGGEGLSGAAATVAVAAASDAAGADTTSQETAVAYSEGMETDGVLIMLDTAAVDADDSALQTLCADESAEVAAAAQDVAAGAAYASADASIEALADLAQAVVEDEGLEVSDQVILDDGTAIVEVAVDDVIVTTYDAEGTTQSSQSAVDTAIDALKDTPGATVVQPNFVYELLDNNGVNDPEAIDQDCWWLDAAGFSSAWQTQKTNNAVTVAVLDSGVMVNHEDLQANILTQYAYDAENESPLKTSVGLGGDSDTSSGHGTHVAGIISAVANNGKGIAGGSYNASILPIKVLNDQGGSSSSKALVVAYQYLLKYADTLNIRVVNMSLGSKAKADGTYPNMMEYHDTGWPDMTLKQAIDTAKSKGIVTVCAGGNSGASNGASSASSPTIYPGDYENCVCVTALTQANELAASSDDNQYKDIAAPGINILSLAATASGSGGYKTLSGSSMAAPMVSAAFALLFTAVPDATVDEASAAIYDTAIKYKNQNSKSGSHGALDVASALSYLKARHNGSFVDISSTSSDYYATPAYYMIAEGIMTGVGTTGQFQADSALTRAQFALILWRLAEPDKATNTPCADTTGLLDIKAGNQWYSAAANWAYSNGYITGVAGKYFSPDQSLTFQDMLVILARFEKGSGNTSVLNNFTDGKDVSAYAKSAVAWAVQNGIVSGYTNAGGSRSLKPGESVTRGRGATIIYNAIQNGYLQD